jgi:hypothetical protein
MGDLKNTRRILMGIQKERHHQKDLDVGGKLILKWILERYDGVVLTELIWPTARIALMSAAMNLLVP